MLKFRVFADMRFLSHAETLRLFHRACARAGLDLAYSSGYNPRPGISLPLPRSVGLACDDETCCLYVKATAPALDADDMKKKLNDRMPRGIELLDAESAPQHASFQSGTAIYEFSINPGPRREQLAQRVSRVLACDSLKLQRRQNDRAKTKIVDVRPFLESVEIRGPKVIVMARFGPQGSIRVDEILSLLGLDVRALDGPVTRTKVLWKSLLNTQQDN